MREGSVFRALGSFKVRAPPISHSLSLTSLGQKREVVVGTSAVCSVALRALRGGANQVKVSVCIISPENFGKNTTPQRNVSLKKSREGWSAMGAGTGTPPKDIITIPGRNSKILEGMR